MKRLAANERHATVQLVAHLAEMDVRRLYLGEGYSSLFTYCTLVLHLSEHAAYARIEAARAARRFPAILEAVASGALHLTAVNLIAPHLTADNIDRVLALATHKTKRDVEEIVATLRPQPPVPCSMRKLPQASQSASRRAAAGHAALTVTHAETGVPPPVALAVEPSRTPDVQKVVVPPRAAIRPLAPEQYLVKFTASRAMHAKLREAQELLRHRVPSGDLAEIFDRAADVVVGRVAKGSTCRNVPAALNTSQLEHRKACRCQRETRGVGSGWRAVCVRRSRRPLHGTRIPRISPRGSVYR